MLARHSLEALQTHGNSAVSPTLRQKVQKPFSLLEWGKKPGLLVFMESLELPSEPWACLALSPKVDFRLPRCPFSFEGRFGAV